VTHRGVADTVTLGSGHAADGGEPDYAALAAAGGTIVLFMALARLDRVAAGLIDAGIAPATPAAVISRGTLPDQQTATAELHAIAAAAEGLLSPALLVVGDVVAIGQTLRAASAVGAAA
jgi:uroporphyrin-III C-methyltransferase